MNITVNIEGNDMVVSNLLALLKSIPDLKIQTKKEKSSELIPNEVTKKAIIDASSGNDCRSFKNSMEMFKSLGINV